MAAIVTFKFALDAIFKDRDLELRVVAVLGALLGMISLFLRPMDIVDDVLVGLYLLSRLNHLMHHEVARVVQLFLLLVSAIASTLRHPLHVVDMLALMAHVSLTATELVIRLIRSVP